MHWCRPPGYLGTRFLSSWQPSAVLGQRAESASPLNRPGRKGGRRIRSPMKGRGRPPARRFRCGMPPGRRAIARTGVATVRAVFLPRGRVEERRCLTDDPHELVELKSDSSPLRSGMSLWHHGRNTAGRCARVSCGWACCYPFSQPPAPTCPPSLTSWPLGASLPSALSAGCLPLARCRYTRARLAPSDVQNPSWASSGAVK